MISSIALCTGEVWKPFLLLYTTFGWHFFDQNAHFILDKNDSQLQHLSFIVCQPSDNRWPVEQSTLPGSNQLNPVWDIPTKRLSTNDRRERLVIIWADMHICINNKHVVPRLRQTTQLAYVMKTASALTNGWPWGHRTVQRRRNNVGAQCECEGDHGLTTREIDRSDNTEAYCKAVANASAFTEHSADVRYVNTRFIRAPSRTTLVNKVLGFI